MGDVIVAGHVCLDIIPGLPVPPSVRAGSLTHIGAMTLQTGGCVGNVAPDLAELNVPVRLAAALGEDDLATTLVALFKRRGLDVSHLRHVPDVGTSYSIVIDAPEMDRSFWHYVGANECFDGADIDFRGAAILYLGYVTLLPRLYGDGGRGALELLQVARAAGVTTCVDAAVVDPQSPAASVDWLAVCDRLLPAVDICTPSIDDLESLRIPESDRPRGPLEWGRWLVDRGAGAALVTDGAAGMCLVSGSADRLTSAGAAFPPAQAATWADLEMSCDAAPVDVRSTTGAGDAAAAGLLCALLQGAAPAEALALAVSCAGQRVSGHPRLHGGAALHPPPGVETS